MLLSWLLLVLLASRPTKGRAVEELAKSAATLLPLLSKMLPMLRLLIKNRWLLLRWRLPQSQADKGRAAEEIAKTAAAAAQRRAADAASEDEKEAASLQIAEETDGDTDQVQVVGHKWLCSSKSVFIKLC